jgi:CBS domain-containing protein
MPHNCLKSLSFRDLSLSNLYSVSVSERLSDLISVKIDHFGIKSRSAAKDLLAVCSFGDILNHLFEGNLQDSVEEILGLEVEAETYLVYYCDESEQVLEACKQFAKRLHRVVVTSAGGLRIATQTDILKAIQNDEIFTKPITEFFKDKTQVDLKFIKSGTSLHDALGIMKKSNLPCLPVLDDGNLVGCLCPLAVSRLDVKHFKEQMADRVDVLVKGLVCDRSLTLGIRNSYGNRFNQDSHSIDA